MGCLYQNFPSSFLAPCSSYLSGNEDFCLKYHTIEIKKKKMKLLPSISTYSESANSIKSGEIQSWMSLCKRKEKLDCTYAWHLLIFHYKFCNKETRKLLNQNKKGQVFSKIVSFSCKMLIFTSVCTVPAPSNVYGMAVPSQFRCSTEEAPK